MLIYTLKSPKQKNTALIPDQFYSSMMKYASLILHNNISFCRQCKIPVINPVLASRSLDFVSNGRQMHTVLLLHLTVL